VLALAAVVIKLQDRGPIFFTQERVGQQGRPFKLWKLRTMVVDAEERLHEVAADNVRQGPLLKVQRDPRVTRIGHFLRSTSIDELPQLWNVLRGDMSTVGPRPALPHEVAAFDDELLERHNVRPGITGLWQVEARDNPSFASYRRLDLFYVKNWSISLDLVILILTAQSVVSRALRSMVDDGDDETAGLS
jgi:lipopolysaccharide/colanic/teichoic acid biosynthesis glycosyltransferase